MAENQIQHRTFEFSRRILRMGRTLQDDRMGKIFVGQLVRSGTSIGANVEEAQAAQSRSDFVAKLSISRKEARETLYWLRLFKAEGVIGDAPAVEPFATPTRSSHSSPQSSRQPRKTPRIRPIFYPQFVIRNPSLAIRHSPPVIRHSSFQTRNL